jgi:hypothetical protein
MAYLVIRVGMALVQLCFLPAPVQASNRFETLHRRAARRREGHARPRGRSEPTFIPRQYALRPERGQVGRAWR